ncbi:MAG TPA: hypothetical protein PLZ37_12690, partial [Nitrospira sp.]|nr:hypothetical protein [Nitrospira sp.]
SRSCQAQASTPSGENPMGRSCIKGMVWAALASCRSSSHYLPHVKGDAVGFCGHGPFGFG